MIADDLKNVHTNTMIRKDAMSSTDSDTVLKIAYLYDANYGAIDAESREAYMSISSALAKKPTTVDELMRSIPGCDSYESLMAHMFVAWPATHDLLKIAAAVNTRVPPFTKRGEWFDNFRLNNYGYQLATVMFNEFDKADANTYVVANPAPADMNESVMLIDPIECVKYLVNSYRLFEWYARDFSVHDVNKYKNFFKYYDSIDDVEAQKICDAIYMRHPFHFGGAHGCDVFEIGKTPNWNALAAFTSRYPSSMIGYILNTETYASGRGQHWVAFVLKDNMAYLLCSQASSFSCFNDGSKLFRHLTTGNGGAHKIFGTVYNDVVIQSDNYNCGTLSSIALYSCIVNYSRNGGRLNIGEIIEYMGRDARNLHPGGADFIRSKIAGTSLGK